ncbi:MAG: hypothetical protein Kow0069_12790 [Promethearchaeota archaeon]
MTRFKIRLRAKRFLANHSVTRAALVVTLIMAAAGVALAAAGTYSPDYRIERVRFTNATFYQKAEKYGDTYLADAYGPEFANVSLKPDDSRVFEIAAYVVTPTGYPAGHRFPVVIWSHGMTANAEFQLHYALEFAHAGFKVVAINLEGMGDSGGLWDLGITDPQVFWSAAEYVAGLPDVDNASIAVSGHSNGGLAAARAGLFDRSPLGTGGLIRSVGSIWSISDFNQTIQELVCGESVASSKLRPGCDPVGDPAYTWFIPLFMGARGDVVTENDLLRRSISHYANASPGNVPNWYLLSGDADQFSSAAVMYSAIAAASDVSPATVQAEVEAQLSHSRVGYWNNSITPQKLADGTARKLYLEKGLDHIKEAMSPALVQELVDWFVLSMGLDPADHVTRMQNGEPVVAWWVARFAGMGLMVAAAFLGQFVVAAYLARVMFPEKRLSKRRVLEEEEADLRRRLQESGDSYLSPDVADYLVVVSESSTRALVARFWNNWKRKAAFWLGMVACVVAGIGLFFWLVPPPITRFWEFNAYVWQFFFGGVVLWVFALATYIYYRRSERYGPFVNLGRLGASWRGFGKGLAYALVVVVFPLSVFNLLAHVTCLPTFLPRPLSEGPPLYGEVLLGAAFVWVLYLPLEVLTKTQLFGLKREFKQKHHYYIEVLANGGLVFLIWAAGYAAGSVFMSPKLLQMVWGGSFGGIIFLGIIALMFAMNGAAAFLTAFIYQRTRNLAACSLYPVILFSCLMFGKFFGIYSVF